MRLALNQALRHFACSGFRGRPFRHTWIMAKKAKLVFGPGAVVRGVAFRENRRVVSADGKGARSCPGCGEISRSRHRSHVGRLQDLPTQGVPVTLSLGALEVPQRAMRSKDLCGENGERAAVCPESAVGRRTRSAARGRVSERLLTRLAMPFSDNAILRQLKRHVRERRETEPLRVIAIDDWSWRKDFTYETIIVDLERRTVAGVLKTRSAQATVGMAPTAPRNRNRQPRPQRALCPRHPERSAARPTGR